MSASAFVTLFSAVPLALFISIAAYATYSYGLYKMADNTGIKPAFMAWIPLLRLYILGQMADRYNSSVEKRSAYRFLLPLLRLIGVGFGVLITVSLVATWLIGINASILLLLCSGVVALSELACRILELLCYYKTICDYEPEYSVLYLILCILGLEWIPMFLCRNNVPVGIAGHCHPRQPRYNVD